MITDVFVFGSRAPVPPGCRRGGAPAPAFTLTGTGEAVLELPWLRPRTEVTRVIPSLSLASPLAYSFCFDAKTAAGGNWISLSPVGPQALPRDHEADATLSPDIDQYNAAPPVPSIRLRVRIYGEDLDALGRAPRLVTVSLSNDPVQDSPRTEAADLEAPPDQGQARRRVALPVPPLSQMETPESIRARICSPTCVAMVLAYLNRRVSPLEVAADVYDPRHDLYGVWPAAIRAAARRGVHGYLLRFPSWDAAAWCLDQGLPIIASLRYAAGELRGAALESTRGHLVVLSGYAGDTVLANDPAAPVAAEVPRRYSLKDIRRVWLARTGVGYVLFDPATAAVRLTA